VDGRRRPSADSARTSAPPLSGSTTPASATPAGSASATTCAG